MIRDKLLRKLIDSFDSDSFYEPLENVLFNEVTSTGTSADFSVFGKKELTIEIIAANVTDGATFSIEATTDQTNYGTIGVVNRSGTIYSDIVIDANGTYYYEVINASSLKYIRGNLSSRSDGTYTMTLLGRA